MKSYSKKGKISTLEMEVALMFHFGVAQNIVVPNVSWAFIKLHECDILKLSKAGYATEVEIKVSKRDLYADLSKKHSHKHKLIKYNYYAVPGHLKKTALEFMDKVDDRFGLLVVTRREPFEGYYKVSEVQKPKISKGFEKWTDKDRLKLCHLGAMRILGLKRKLVKLKLSK